ncbi:MAG: HAD hydrolase family protein [Actinomycetota bacterium]
MPGSDTETTKAVGTLVVTDLDGTVWDNTLRCHPATVEAIAELHRRDDVELIAATGRRRNSARRAFDANGIVMPAVLLNGAVGYDFVIEELFHMVTFTADALERTLGILGSHGIAPVAYLADTTAVALEDVTTSTRHLDTLDGDLVWWTLDELATRDDVLGLSMLGVDRDFLAPAHAELAGYDDTEVHLFVDHLYPPGSLMIAPADVDKRRGIQAWIDHRGDTPPARILGIGDAGNDLPMLELADIPVAVATAFPEVMAIAEHVIGPPAEGGWADVLDLL